jgi:hypothetical protein
MNFLTLNRRKGYLESWSDFSKTLSISAPRPGRFTPGKDPVPIVQEAGSFTEADSYSGFFAVNEEAGGLSWLTNLLRS